MCNGAVVLEIGKSLVKVCTDGKVKLKPRKQVGFGTCQVNLTHFGNLARFLYLYFLGGCISYF